MAFLLKKELRILVNSSDKCYNRVVKEVMAHEEIDNGINGGIDTFSVW